MVLWHLKNVYFPLVIALVIFDHFTVAFTHVKKYQLTRSNPTITTPNLFKNDFSQPRKNFSLLKSKNEKSASDDKNDDIIEKKFSFERESYETFGILTPIAKLIDEKTGEWGLNYADTGPYTDKSIIGLIFLSTNILYFAVGLNLYATENYLMSVTIEIAGLASFYYHWSQIHYGPGKDEVRVALLTDYITAFLAINVTFIEICQLVINVLNSGDGDHFPFAPIAYGLTGLLCLFGSWIYEYELPYILLHGLWHVFSAAAALSVGNELYLRSHSFL